MLVIRGGGLLTPAAGSRLITQSAPLLPRRGRPRMLPLDRRTVFDHHSPGSLPGSRSGSQMEVRRRAELR